LQDICRVLNVPLATLVRKFEKAGNQTGKSPPTTG
jgi:hypothetical protein